MSAASATVTTASPAATRAVAARLAEAARPGDVVLLVGGLGAGKTTFAQGFAAALGVKGPVTSPTFTLVRQYPCRLGQLLHADVYRLEHLAEVEDLGLGELVEEDGVALVEWGDAAAPVLGAVACTVRITRPGDAGTSGGTAAGPAAGPPADIDIDTDTDPRTGARTEPRTVTVEGERRYVEAVA